MFEQAVAQEQRNAAYLLAQIYQKGDGVPKSIDLALEWFEKSHEWGRPDAARQIATIYLRRGYRKEGEKTLLNASQLEKAQSWFAIAAEQDPRPEKREELRALIKSLQALIDAAK